MRYRIYLEAVDVEANTPQEALKEYNYRCGMKCEWPEPSKILPIDKDGFIIEQPKQVE